jgi:heme exporter protein A
MLEIADLECARGGRSLFRGRSFALRGGELLHVAGANGSGKTSLLRILCGLLPPQRGEVRWQGSPIRALREEYSKQLVYLGHAAALKDDLTAAENLSIACRIAGKQLRSSEIHRALEIFGVPDAGTLARKLSQGQRRRAVLARLALSEPVPLWLLDEPFAALDAAAAGLAEELIARHVARGGIAIYTTHQEARIEASARVLSLDGPHA